MVCATLTLSIDRLVRSGSPDELFGAFGPSFLIVWYERVVLTNCLVVLGLLYQSLGSFGPR